MKYHQGVGEKYYKGFKLVPFKRLNYYRILIVKNRNIIIDATDSEFLNWAFDLAQERVRTMVREKELDNI